MDSFTLGIPYYVSGIVLAIAGITILGITYMVAPIFPAILVDMIMVMSFCLFIISGIVFYLGWKKQRIRSQYR